MLRKIAAFLFLWYFIVGRFEMKNFPVLFICGEERTGKKMEWCGILYEGRFSEDKILRVIRTVFVFLILCTVVMEVHSGNPTIGTGDYRERTEMEIETADVVSDALQNSVAEYVLGVPVCIPEVPEVPEVSEVLQAEAVMETPAIPETLMPAAKTDVQSPSLSIPAVSAPMDTDSAVSEFPSYVPSVPEISVPAEEEVLVPEIPSEPAENPGIPSEPTADKPETDSPVTDTPVATVPAEPAPTEPTTGVINGFLVDESGIIYGVADPEIVVTDGYMELPGEGCSGIAAGTFSEGLLSAREMYIPSNITYIEPGAFSGLTNMEWIEMEPAGGYYTEQGVLFSEEGKCILAFPAARTGNYKVPSQVAKFAAGAFDDAQIQVVDAAMCTLTDISSFPEHIELIAKETP